MQTFVPYPDIVKSVKCLDNLRLNKQILEVAALLKSSRQGPKCMYRTDTSSTSTKRKFVYGELLQEPLPTDLSVTSTPWYNHPARKMWHGYETSLYLYGIRACQEFTRRSTENKVHATMNWLIEWVTDNTDWLAERVGASIPSKQHRAKFKHDPLQAMIMLPPWWGDEFVHSSHRSNLLRKDPQWYGQFGWSEKIDKPYIWPVIEAINADARSDRDGR